jgi:glycosyltransferase involved in cell wall biosynthesis
VPPQDPVALARALDELLADPERRHLLGHKAQEAIRLRLDPNAWIRAVEQVYVEAVAEPRARRRRPNRRAS